MPTLKPGQRVMLYKDIIRADAPYGRPFYAREGDEGVVIETFKVKQSPSQKPIWHAKVLMADSEVKTFRITSLEIV